LSNLADVIHSSDSTTVSRQLEQKFPFPRYQTPQPRHHWIICALSELIGWILNRMLIYTLVGTTFIFGAYVILRFGTCTIGGMLNSKWGCETLITNPMHWFFDKLQTLCIKLYNIIFPEVRVEHFHNTALSKARLILNDHAATIQNLTREILTYKDATSTSSLPEELLKSLPNDIFGFGMSLGLVLSRLYYFSAETITSSSFIPYRSATSKTVHNKDLESSIYLITKSIDQKKNLTRNIQFTIDRIQSRLVVRRRRYLYPGNPLYLPLLMQQWLQEMTVFLIQKKKKWL